MGFDEVVETTLGFAEHLETPLRPHLPHSLKNGAVFDRIRCGEMDSKPSLNEK